MLLLLVATCLGSHDTAVKYLDCNTAAAPALWAAPATLSLVPMPVCSLGGRRQGGIGLGRNGVHQGVTRRNEHRPGLASNDNAMHVTTARSSAALMKPSSNAIHPRKRHNNPTISHTPSRIKSKHRRRACTGTRPHAPSEQAGDHPVPAHTERHNPSKVWTRRQARSPSASLPIKWKAKCLGQCLGQGMVCAWVRWKVGGMAEARGDWGLPCEGGSAHVGIST